MTIVPAYGRDYSSKAKAEKDFREGKDFKISSVGPWMGAYMSIRDLQKGEKVTIRYKKLSLATVVTV